MKTLRIVFWLAIWPFFLLAFATGGAVDGLFHGFAEAFPAWRRGLDVLVKSRRNRTPYAVEVLRLRALWPCERGCPPYPSVITCPGCEARHTLRTLGYDVPETIVKGEN